MNSKTATIIKWSFEIALIIILSFIYYLNQSVQTQKVLYIPKGSINQIITQLQERNYNVGKLDALLLRAIGSPQSGWIDVGTNSCSRADFLYKLTHAKAALQQITLIPGETTYIFIKQLSKKLNLNEDKLFDAYNKQTYIKEGALVPNTYNMPIGITEKELMRILLKSSKQQMVALSNKFFGSYNKKRWTSIISTASIIQKESASIKEMPIVGSVIQNRIKKKMKLQMDGTLNYGKYSHIKVTPKRIREDDSIYNTYRRKGIPRLPVCNVSFDAIRAAVFPAKTKFLYFMKNAKGEHDFTRHYSTHLTNIKRATKRNKR